MKKDKHPNYYTGVNVVCSCGNRFVIGSTYDQPELSIEVCSHCHPFYTGKQKIIVSDRIQRFKDRYKKSGVNVDSGAAA